MVEVRAVARQLNPHDPLLIEPFCDVKMISESEKKWRKVDQTLLRKLAGKFKFQRKEILTQSLNYCHLVEKY